MLKDVKCVHKPPSKWKQRKMCRWRMYEHIYLSSVLWRNGALEVSTALKLGEMHFESRPQSDKAQSLQAELCPYR